MKILFDQGVPAPLRTTLIGHLVETAYERGWATLTNGDLISRADAAAFDVFITTDQNLSQQQRLAHRRIAVIVLATTRWPEIQQHAAAVAAAAASIQPGECLDMHW